MTAEVQKDNPRLTAAVKAVETRTKLWRGLEKWAVLHAADAGALVHGGRGGHGP